MERFAARFPLIAMTRILGVPEADIDQFAQWSDDMIALMSPATPPDARLESATRAADFYDYCQAFILDRRRDGKDDLTTALVNATVEDGSLLDERELVSILAQLIVGGHETSTYMIGNVVLRLLERPALLEEVSSDPTLVAAAVEESLRHTGPVRGLFRVALADVSLGDVHIPKGDTVAVHYASANHDEAHFDRPEEFDIHRTDVQDHLGLGKGTHFCLGAPLVRVEGRLALQGLLSRLPGLRLAEGGRVTFAPTPIHHGLKHLDIAWDV
jgi:cytochrome P450